MKENIENKLMPLLKSLETKLNENLDFFKDIEIELLANNKKLKSKIHFNDIQEMVYESKQNKKNIAIDEISSYVIEISRPYENCVIKYNERGNSILIWTEKGNVKIKNIADNANTGDTHSDVSSRSNRNYIIKVGEADSLLKEIQILTKEGKVRNDMIRKYNQIDHFVELIDPLLKELMGKEKITILDCACGKSYLSFVLNYYIKEKLKKSCHFIGIDISENVINASKEMAKNLGYKNMEFIAMDIQNYIPDQDIDIVISLHGCDIATDMAMAAGVRYNAEVIFVVPCCHSEILNQYHYDPMKEIIKHGVLKARMADILTEGIRILLLEAMGYEVSIVEYISPLDTPKNLLIRAHKKLGKSRKAYEEYLNLKNMLGIHPTLGKLLNL